MITKNQVQLATLVTMAQMFDCGYEQPIEKPVWKGCIDSAPRPPAKVKKASDVKKAKRKLVQSSKRKNR